MPVDIDLALRVTFLYLFLDLKGEMRLGGGAIRGLKQRCSGEEGEEEDDGASAGEYICSIQASTSRISMPSARPRTQHRKASSFERSHHDQYSTNIGTFCAFRVLTKSKNCRSGVSAMTASCSYQRVISG